MQATPLDLWQLRESPTSSTVYRLDARRVGGYLCREMIKVTTSVGEVSYVESDRTLVILTDILKTYAFMKVDINMMEKIGVPLKDELQALMEKQAAAQKSGNTEESTRLMAEIQQVKNCMKPE